MAYEIEQFKTVEEALSAINDTLKSIDYKLYKMTKGV